MLPFLVRLSTAPSKSLNPARALVLFLYGSGLARSSLGAISGPFQQGSAQTWLCLAGWVLARLLIGCGSAQAWLARFRPRRGSGFSSGSIQKQFRSGFGSLWLCSVVAPAHFGSRSAPLQAQFGKARLRHGSTWRRLGSGMAQLGAGPALARLLTGCGSPRAWLASDLACLWCVSGSERLGSALM